MIPESAKKYVQDRAGHFIKTVYLVGVVIILVIIGLLTGARPELLALGLLMGLVFLMIALGFLYDLLMTIYSILVASDEATLKIIGTLLREDNNQKQ